MGDLESPARYLTRIVGLTMRIRLLSNLPNLGQVAREGVDVEHVEYPYTTAGRPAAFRALWRSLNCDYAVINCSPLELVVLCATQYLWPFSKCKIVSLDTVLPVPRLDSFRDRVVLQIKRLLFTRVHLFIEYFREVDGYVRHYGMPAEKFRYIPFKINRYERVLKTPVSDGGYIFCGGNTRRDFATLFAAVRDLPYPVRVVTMSDRVIAENGSYIDGDQIPANVELVRHDGSDSFLDHVAAATLVVLPIRRANISASGIGVYLASMALGKCVIISEGPSVNGVLPDGAAIVVPPEQPAALRDAIVRAWTDDVARAAIARRGQQYALSLGGEERLCASVLDVLSVDATTRGFHQ